MHLDDGAALDTIAFIMSGTEWSPDTLEAIAELVIASGRSIAEPFRVAVD